MATRRARRGEQGFRAVPRIQSVDVGLDDQPLALGGTPLGGRLLRVACSLRNIFTNLPQGFQGVDRPCNRHRLGTTRELESLALFLASLVELFSKAFQIPVIQCDGNRLTTALRLKAQTQIDIFGKPPSVLALLGDEGRVIGLLDPKAAHTLGVFRKIEDVGRAYEAGASPVVQRAAQQS